MDGVWLMIMSYRRHNIRSVELLNFVNRELVVSFVNLVQFVGYKIVKQNVRL